MRDKVSSNRRHFLKMSAAGIAGLSAGIDRVFAGASAWTDKMAINPNIDNMRVICCHDTAMLQSGAVMTTFASQNNAVKAAIVEANLDEMARQLATVSGQPVPTADDAWKKIFRSGKAWTDTKVAIKVNCVCLQNMPRVAIIGKLVKVLTGFGVQGKNIIVYDGNADASGNTKYTPYFSLTDASKINATVSSTNSLLGGKTSVTIDGWTAKSFTCTTDIALGNIDILINLAVNKGHDRPDNGYYTLCMKNHYGTFDPASDLHGSTVPFISINKHNAIIGGTPVRQQLCIIDSLLGSIDHNPGTPPDVSPPYRIIMGTFAPAVDYLCVKKVREPIMNAVHNATVVNGLMGNFGYTSADPQWVEIAATGLGRLPGRDARQGAVDVVLTNRGFKTASAHFSPQSDLSSPVEIRIFDMTGNLVRTLDSHATGMGRTTIAWDGISRSGRTVSAGRFLVKARAGNWSAATTMTIEK